MRVGQPGVVSRGRAGSAARPTDRPAQQALGSRLPALPLPPPPTGAQAQALRRSHHRVSSRCMDSSLRRNVSPLTSSQEPSCGRAEVQWSGQRRHGCSALRAESACSSRRRGAAPQPAASSQRAATQGRLRHKRGAPPLDGFLPAPPAHHRRLPPQPTTLDTPHTPPAPPIAQGHLWDGVVVHEPLQPLHQRGIQL